MDETTTPDRTRLPIAILPWLSLPNSFNVAGIHFGTLASTEAILSEPKFLQAKALLQCFAEPVGRWFGEEHSVHSVPQPTIAVPVQGSLGTLNDQAVEERTMKRLRRACSVLGAVLLHYHPEWTADVVKALNVWLTGDDPQGPFRVPQPDGSFVSTSVAAYLVVRPPWTATECVVEHKSDGVWHLERRIDPALSGDLQSNRILRSLDSFVQTHGYNFNGEDLLNLVALGTALEILLDLVGEQDKRKQMRRRILDVTGSEKLANYAAKFYAERSELVHAGESPRPMLDGGHMSHLQFGRQLYWQCLRELLASEPYVIRRLESSLEAHKVRLEKLVKMSLVNVAKDPKRHDEFLNLLQTFPGNQMDRTGPPSLCRAAVQRVCGILKEALYYHASGNQGEVANNMRYLAGILEAMSKDDNLEPETVEERVLGLDPSENPGALVPIIADNSLSKLLMHYVKPLVGFWESHTAMGWPHEEEVV